MHSTIFSNACRSFEFWSQSPHRVPCHTDAWPPMARNQVCQHFDSRAQSYLYHLYCHPDCSFEELLIQKSQSFERKIHDKNPQQESMASSRVFCSTLQLWQLLSSLCILSTWSWRRHFGEAQRFSQVEGMMWKTPRLGCWMWDIVFLTSWNMFDSENICRYIAATFTTYIIHILSNYNGNMSRNQRCAVCWLCHSMLMVELMSITWLV